MEPTDHPPAGDSAEPQQQPDQSQEPDQGEPAPDLSPFAVKSDPKPHPGVDPVTGSRVKPATDARTRPTHDASGGSRPGTGAPAVSTESIETVKRLRSTAWLAAFALPLAIVLAPIGAVVGALALFRLARLRPAIERAGIKSAVLVFPVISSVAAVVVGALLSIAVVIIRDELSELNSCMSGANTRVAEENCQARFTEQVEQRLGRDLG